ncbi:nucleoside-triphosphatase [Anaerolinea sp.]|uniref:nucleoside-triphosphatase n=1 Tax=Anaerolinea sp. TaxID=1872519 RepID=UPI002ACDB17F|nr:nucleoside-triphosphatase [Anaerolinea sp.]
MDVRLSLVTGWRGSGKTTFCAGMVQAARQAGWDVAGLLSPAGFEEGRKTCIRAEDLRTGERRLLASISRQSDEDLAFGDWFFNLQTLQWGNRVLQASTPCDLLVVDELGPLEFRLSQGWVSALEVLQRGGFRRALVVIRPELLEEARSLWRPDLIISLDKADRVEEKVEAYARRLLMDG